MSDFPFFRLCDWDSNARESLAWFPFAAYRRVHSSTPQSLLQPSLFCNLGIHKGCFSLSFQPPPFFSLLLPSFSPLLEHFPLPALSVLEVTERGLEARAVSLLSPTDMSGFTSLTQFARAAYCPQSKIKNWGCGGKLSLFPICDWD